jgi:hypothetical protein
MNDFSNTKQTNQPAAAVNDRLGMASVAVQPPAVFRSVSDLERRNFQSGRFVCSHLGLPGFPYPDE